MVGFIEPVGTWFQSAIADRKSTITTKNISSPRHSRQNLSTIDDQSQSQSFSLIESLLDATAQSTARRYYGITVCARRAQL
jgi:hypothetical protein